MGGINPNSRDYHKEVPDMAKKVTGYIKLQIPAGKATPAPPVGPALGQHGVNIVEFTKQFNARTADKGDMIISPSDVNAKYIPAHTTIPPFTLTYMPLRHFL